MNQQPFLPGPGDQSGLAAPGRLSLEHQQLPLHELLPKCLCSGRSDLLWSEFIRRSQPVIAGVIVRTMRRWTSPSPTMVDDLVQETYLKLCANDFRALREFECEHENALYGFLKVVASHVVHDHFRGSFSQKRGNGRDAEDLDRADAGPARAAVSERCVERQILFHQITGCLKNRASGPTFARDYAIFWLYYVQGYTARAIAQLPSIGLTIKGVESTIMRLTRLVREGLTGKTSTAVD